MVTGDDALLDLLAALKSRDYRFVCVSPCTHQRVLARPFGEEPTLRDIFGWNRAFNEGQLDQSIEETLLRADCIERSNGQLRSLVRVASLGDRLFLHSAYPTDGRDAVFFGPDTYRFARWISDEIPRLAPAKSIVDMGAGSGAGGIVAMGLVPSAKVVLVDINPAATRFARLNAKAAGADVELLLSDAMPSDCDLVIANPPYMMDSEHRTYRDGGDRLGGGIALDWARQALNSLVPGGTMLLYTGAAVLHGRSPLVGEIQALCSERRASATIEEIDADVFGEDLERAEYQGVERIAALGIRITAR